ncbi:ABC transporter permease [Neobacillus sp. LXY-4]|uniref:ABC transporter permease n=1 Tax=Neobacillus sp. LXY-4 TaxID=3379826 RepID=UPI003EE3F712
MNAFKLVFLYSFLEKIKSKGFFVTTFITVGLLAAVIFLPDLYNKMSSDVEKKVYVINEIENLPLSSEILKENISKDYKWIITSKEKEKKLIKSINKDEKIMLIKISQPNNTTPTVEVTSNNMQEWSFVNSFINTIQSMHMIQTIESMELTHEQASKLTTPIDVKMNEVNNKKKSFEENYIPIYLTLFLLYFLIMNFGSNVGTSIAIEKSSRIKEVLITKVKPIYLLSGKICGIGTAGLLQFGIIIISLLLLLKVNPNKTTELFGMNFDLSILTGDTLIYLLLFFILGYILYSALFAAIGSLVSRSEEINQAAVPVSVLMMVGFLMGISIMADADSQLARTLSYVPFFSPFIMIVRIGMTTISPVELILPTAVLLIFIILTCFVAAKVYKVGVLIYGKKPNVKLLFKSMKQM